MATLQLSVTARNSLLDAIETAIGGTAVIELRSGAMPANCAAARTGTQLAIAALPADWLAAAAAGAKAKAGTWTITGGAGRWWSHHRRIRRVPRHRLCRIDYYCRMEQAEHR